MKRFRLFALVGGLLMASIAAAGAKDAPTYYTPERIAAGKENLAGQEWAKGLFSRIRKGDGNDYYIGREYGAAADCIEKSDDFVWLMQPTTKIPRKMPNHDTVAMCPIHGTEVRKLNAWTAWTTDPVRHPYKVRCRLGGEWYPSNDFMNGDLTSGEFPDDGTGCRYKGKTYYFLHDYAHMAYGNNTIPCLRSLSQAWLLTGDRRYARKGCILLARLASEYPNFTDRKDRLYFAPYGGRDPHYTWKTGGMITDLIWETFCLEATAYAYDGLFNYMDQDPEMIAFLKAKGMPVNSGSELRKYIEENLLRVGMQGLLNGHIHGNEGFHQAAAMACALVMDDYGDTHPNSKEMVDWAFLGGGHAAYIISNTTYRDGAGGESPGYNAIKFDFIRVNQLMEEVRRRRPDLYPPERYPDLFGGAKGKALFDHFMGLSVLSTFLPSIGDACGIRAPERHKPGMWSYVAGSKYLYGFERFRDPLLARACTRSDGSLAAGELFEPYPDAEMKAALARPDSQIQYRDRLLDGYGVGILETGPASTGHALSLNYSAIPGHRQYDNLNLEIFARGLDILPDLGYPFTWDYREWDSGTMSHNTVSVDETSAEYTIGGQANLLASADGVHVISARHDPYPSGAAAPAAGKPAQGVTRYERTSVMVDVDADRFYVVDLFAVNGGQPGDASNASVDASNASVQDQHWHGPLTPMQLPALNWTEQPAGTLAGPEVAHGAKYTDRWGRTAVGFPCYLAKIRRADLSAPAVFHWDYGLPEGDALNLHVLPLGGPAQVIAGTGRSPARPVDWGLDYVLIRRKSLGQKPNYFLSVLDPYQKAPTVQSVKVLSEEPGNASGAPVLVIQVARADGAVDDLTLPTPAGPSRTTEHRPLGLLFRSRAGGKVTREVQIGTVGTAGVAGKSDLAGGKAGGAGKSGAKAAGADRAGEKVPAGARSAGKAGEKGASAGAAGGPGYATATVKAVDWERNEITLPYQPGMEKDFPVGRYLRVYNWGRSAMCRILSATRQGKELRLALDTTALLAQGPVVKTADGAIFVGDTLLFANGRADDKGVLPLGNDYFAGSFLSDGKSTHQLAGAVRDNPTKLYLKQPLPQADLEKVFAGKIVRVWQYGVGDTVEIARVK